MRKLCYCIISLLYFCISMLLLLLYFNYRDIMLRDLDDKLSGHQYRQLKPSSFHEAIETEAN